MELNFHQTRKSTGKTLAIFCNLDKGKSTDTSATQRHATFLGMNSSASEMVEESDKSNSPDHDPKPNIPLRQRRLPASFWQEPCLAPSSLSREILQSSTMPSSIHQYAVTSQPWTINSTSMPPMVLPQRFVTPNNFLISQDFGSQWIRNSSCCTCASCLNYPHVIPHLPEAYGSLRYRVPTNVSYCPGINCIDQSCKLCYTASEYWHPDRLRHLRLRAARYNAILD